MTDLFFQQEFSVAKILIALSVLALLGYASIVGALYLAQERIIFPGSKLPPDYKFNFDQPFREVQVEVPGASLNALHITQPAPRGLLFFIHGNGGDLSTWTTGVDFYRKVNYDLFIFDYRGYGKSTGKIASEKQLLDDADQVYRYVSQRYAAQNIVLYGRSLGTGLAAQIALRHPANMLILETPYVSLKDLTAQFYPLVPGFLLKYPLRTDLALPKIKIPVYLFHGTADEVIPYESSQRILPLIRSPKELVTIPGGAHNGLRLTPVYNAALDRFLR